MSVCLCVYLCVCVCVIVIRPNFLYHFYVAALCEINYILHNAITVLKLIHAVTQNVKNHHTNVNVDIKNFMFANNLASLTALATVTWVDALALSLAFTTHCLRLLNKAGQHLLYVYLGTSTRAASAQLHGTLSTTAAYRHTHHSHSVQ